MKNYPNSFENTVEDLGTALRAITRLRQQDVADFNNLPNVFISGRRVGKIPTSSADVADTDKIGDVSFALDGSYVYYLISNAGVASWRRVALASW
jgi:hypothetical protein